MKQWSEQGQMAAVMAAAGALKETGAYSIQTRNWLRRHIKYLDPSFQAVIAEKVNQEFVARGADRHFDRSGWAVIREMCGWKPEGG